MLWDGIDDLTSMGNLLQGPQAVCRRAQLRLETWVIITFLNFAMGKLPEPEDEEETYSASSNELKERFKYSGWLQYSIGFFLAVPPLLLEFAFEPTSPLLLQVSGFILCLATFDLLTVKLDLRPLEALPRRHDKWTHIQATLAAFSCHSFQNRPLLDEHRSEVMKVSDQCIRGRLFDKKIRFEHIAQPFTVWPAVNCREFIVAIASKKDSKLANIDVGRSLEKLVLHATRMGVNTCIMGPDGDHTGIIQELGSKFNSEEDHIVSVVGLGYVSWYSPVFLRVVSSYMHRRKPLTRLFFQNAKCTAPIDVDQEPFTQFQKAFECCRSAPSPYNAQTTRGVMLVENGAVRQLDFYCVDSSKRHSAVALGIWMANWEGACEEIGFTGKFVVDSRRALSKNTYTKQPLYAISWVLDTPVSNNIEAS